MIRTNRWTAWVAAAILGAATQGCIVAEELSEVKLLPEGPLRADLADRTVLIFVKTRATGSVRLVVDGVERDVALRANEAFHLHVDSIGVGEHRLRARVYDGAYPVESNVLELTLRAGPTPVIP